MALAVFLGVRNAPIANVSTTKTLQSEEKKKRKPNSWRELNATKRVWEKEDFSGTRWTCGDYVPINANQSGQQTWIFNSDGTSEWHIQGRTIPSDINWVWNHNSLMITYSDGRTNEFIVTAHEGLVWENGNEFYLIEGSGELSRAGYVHCLRDIA